MRTLLSVITLMALAMPAFADVNLVPEPGSLALVGIGAAALLFGARRKK